MPVKTLLVVSHYTRSTGYEDEVRNLVSSLIELNIPHQITSIQSRGTWRENSNWCAVNVQQALRDNPNCNILRVDADAVFHKRPVLLEQDPPFADVAAHVHDFSWHPNELLGGTLFFQNVDKVRVLVNKWVQLACRDRRTERNGDLLQELINIHHWIQFAALPSEYCKIFDKMPEVVHPVIEHFQASRRFKRQINQAWRTRHD